jgi:hypothetical protein
MEQEWSASGIVAGTGGYTVAGSGGPRGWTVTYAPAGGDCCAPAGGTSP